MQTDKNISVVSLVNRIDRTSLHTFSTTDTEFFPDNHATTLALAEGARRAGRNTRGRITSQAQHRNKSG